VSRSRVRIRRIKQIVLMGLEGCNRKLDCKDDVLVHSLWLDVVEKLHGFEIVKIAISSSAMFLEFFILAVLRIVSLTVSMTGQWN